jgi:exonuclease SbcD
VTRFAHLSDLHVGGFQKSLLRKKEEETIGEFVQTCLTEKVEFVVMSGDVFDSNIPPISQAVKLSKHLKAMKESGVRIYAIYGNHDFSATKTSLLELLDADGLLRIVNEPIHDKSGIIINGIHGTPGAKEVASFGQTERLEHKGGEPAVFMMHTAVLQDRVKVDPEQCIPMSLVPKGYSYIAAGHLHKRLEFRTEDGVPLNYPGPLFIGYGLSDLEGYMRGDDRGFYLVDLEPGDTKFEYIRIRKLEGDLLDVDAEAKDESEVKRLVEKALTDAQGRYSSDALLLLKVHGRLRHGRKSNITLFTKKKEKDFRFHIEFNDRSLYDPDEEVAEPGEELEKRIYELMASKFPAKVNPQFIEELLDTLSEEKREGMTTDDYREHIVSKVQAVLRTKLGDDFELQN